MNGETFDFGLFMGAWHPVLVHLPIGFLVLLAVLELFARRPRFKHLSGCRTFIAALALPAAAASALCGWLLAQGGSYDALLLQWHQWTGFGVAAASLVLVLLLW